VFALILVIASIEKRRRMILFIFTYHHFLKEKMKNVQMARKIRRLLKPGRGLRDERRKTAVLTQPA